MTLMRDMQWTAAEKLALFEKLGHRRLVWVLFAPGLESDQPPTVGELGPDLPVHNMAAHYPPRAAAVKDGA
jgi:hypothetical protein